MIVVDTSVIVALFRLEKDAETLGTIIAAAEHPRISAASVVETLIVLDNRTGVDNSSRLRNMLYELGIEIEPVNVAQMWIAADAYRRFGKGNHAARLNFGDCFAYALAKSLDLPLLFKGEDFRRTDIRPAV